MRDVEALTGVQLRDPEREIVAAILQSYVPTFCVWVFGSRASWSARPFSDLDLGIDGREPLDLGRRAEIVEAFEESDLPFRVDVVDLAAADLGFAEKVRQTGVLWPGYKDADSPRD